MLTTCCSQCPSVFDTDATRHGLPLRRSYVAPRPRSRTSAKQPKNELTCCLIYSFKFCVSRIKDLTPALFCARVSGAKGIAQLVEHDLAEVGAGRGASRVRVSFPAPVVTKKPLLKRFFCARNLGELAQLSCGSETAAMAASELFISTLVVKAFARSTLNQSASRPLSSA